jgi:hypothetical protein
METNSEHQQPPLFPERSAFKQINDLGKPLGWMHSKPNIAGLILSLFFLCAYVATFTQSLSNPSGSSITVGSTICYMVFVVIIPLVFFIRSLGKEIAIYELGFAYKTPFDFRQYRWDQVVALKENKNKSKAKLTMKDGRKISLSDDYRKKERIALVDSIRGKVSTGKQSAEEMVK